MEDKNASILNRNFFYQLIGTDQKLNKYKMHKNMCKKMLIIALLE